MTSAGRIDAGPIIREPSGSTGYRPSFLFFPSTSFQLVRAHAQVYVLLRLVSTLASKEICHTLGDGLRLLVMEHDPVKADVHFFRDQRNRFKSRAALACLNSKDGSGRHTAHRDCRTRQPCAHIPLRIPGFSACSFR